MSIAIKKENQITVLKLVNLWFYFVNQILRCVVNFGKQKEVEEIKNLGFRMNHSKEDSRTRQKEFRIAFNLHASLPTQFVLHKF